jgi:hypothetical protein
VALCESVRSSAFPPGELDEDTVRTKPPSAHSVPSSRYGAAIALYSMASDMMNRTVGPQRQAVPVAGHGGAPVTSATKTSGELA